jgi:hypothetical protein
LNKLKTDYYSIEIFGDGVPLTNARAGLITPDTPAFAAVELILCVHAMTEEVFVS